MHGVFLGLSCCFLLLPALIYKTARMVATWCSIRLALARDLDSIKVFPFSSKSCKVSKSHCMCGLSWQPLLCEVRSSRRGASRAASVASRAASVASAAVELRASPGPAAVGFSGDSTARKGAQSPMKSMSMHIWMIAMQFSAIYGYNQIHVMYFYIHMPWVV